MAAATRGARSRLAYSRTRFGRTGRACLCVRVRQRLFLGGVWRLERRVGVCGVRGGGAGGRRGGDAWEAE
eukprot:3313583-Pleurochrysis_carterae.AAC.1